MSHLHKVLSKRYNFCYLKSLRLLNAKRNIVSAVKKCDKYSSASSYKYYDYLPMNYNVLKCYTTKCDDDDFNSDTFENEPIIENMLSEVNVRLNLYDTSDPLINKLTNCNSIQEVLDIVSDESSELKCKHLCEAVLVLWDLQKEYNKSYLDNLIKIDNDTSPIKLLENYIQDRNSNVEFDNFLTNLFNRLDSMTVKEIVYCLYYLKKMSVDLGKKEFQNMIQACNDKILANQHELDCKTVMKYTNYMLSPNGLRFAYTAAKIVPAINTLLNNCNSVEDFHNLTVCYGNIHIIISKDLLNNYKKKLMKLLKTGVLTTNDYKTLIQVLIFLNLRHWFISNSRDIYMICNIITPMVHQMNIEEVVTLHKVFKDHLEPALLLTELKAKVKLLLEEIKFDDRIKTYTKLPDLLYCQTSISELSNRNLLKNIVAQLVETGYTTTLLSIFNSLRYLKINDPVICDKFWYRTAELFINNSLYNNKTILLCHMYIYFCFNIDGTYRNKYFENSMLKHLQNVIAESYESFLPWKFVRILSFIIACKPISTNEKSYYSFLDKLIKKYHNIAHQMMPRDILYLMKSLQLLQLLNKKNASEYDLDLINTMKISIKDCNTRFLNDKKSSIFNLNNICKTNIMLGNKSSMENMDKIFTKYNKVAYNELSSVSIRQSIYNFFDLNIYAKTFLNKIADYCLFKKENIYGDTILKVMTCFYNTAITPKEDFLKLFIEIFERDMYDIKSIKLLDQSITLCYFQCLPETIIQYIFSIEFMEKLDDEIMFNSPYPHYPKSVREKLMELNRAVCLEIPEHKIPWFHQKYLQEIATYASIKMNYYQQDVLEHLLEIVDDRNLIEIFHSTPYGYNIDFHLQKDRNGNFIPISQNCNEMEVQKIAIVLEKSNSLVKLYDLEEETNSPIIKYVKSGRTLLRNRHLEIMGYKVIEIYDSLWNSMHMSEPKAKFNHLNSVL